MSDPEGKPPDCTRDKIGGYELDVSHLDRVKGWRHYYLIGGSLLLTGLIVATLILFWDKIQDAAAYGYVGCFVITIVAGVSVLPAPAMPVVFTLGHKLHPLFVGLVAGLGEALGGITIYLAGAGGGTMWAKIQGKRRVAGNSPNGENGDIPLVSHEIQSRQRAFFNRMISPMRRWGGAWPVFIAAAVVFSPYYFVGLGAGALRMGLRRFFLISWAGKTVKGLYIAFAGYWGLYFLLQWLGG